MSSDVYMGFCARAPNPSIHSMTANCRGCSRGERIGDLGVLTYFGYNLIKEFDAIGRHSRFTSEWVEQAKAKVRTLHEVIERNKLMTSEEFIQAYGYMNDGIDWEDVLQVAELDEMLQEHKDCYWSIWCD